MTSTSAKSDQPVTDEDDSLPKKEGRPRGFASMDRNVVSEIAKRGGEAAQRAGTANRFTTEKAREAGRKGGLAADAKRWAARREGT